MGKLNREKRTREGLRPSTKESKKGMVVGRSRKVKISYAKVTQALIKTKGRVTHAAKYLGTTFDTLNAYIKESPKLKALVAGLLEHRLDNAERRLDELVDSHDKTAIIFFLKTQGKKRGYIEEEKMDLSKLAQPITFIYQPAPRKTDQDLPEQK